MAVGYLPWGGGAVRFELELYVEEKVWRRMDVELRALFYADDTVSMGGMAEGLRHYEGLLKCLERMLKENANKHDGGI